MAGKGVTVCDTLAEAERAIDELSAGAARGPRRGPRLGRHRGAADRPGGEPDRHLRRQDAQSRCRWPAITSDCCDGDRGPEHRWDGCLQPAPGAVGRGRAGPASALPPADPGRAGPPRHPVPWRALRGSDAHRGWPGPARVQRALRRPRDAGRPAAACRRPRSDPAGRRARRPRAGARSVRAPRRAPPDSSPAHRSRSSWPPRATPKRRDVGDRIEGLDEAAATGALVFHSGTVRDTDGAFRTAGGRVLSVVGRGPRSGRGGHGRIHAAADLIHAPGLQRRHDIGAREGLRPAPVTPSPPDRPPDDPALHAPRDGRHLVGRRQVRGHAPGRAGGRPRPVRARPGPARCAGGPRDALARRRRADRGDRAHDRPRRHRLRQPGRRIGRPRGALPPSRSDQQRRRRHRPGAPAARRGGAAAARPRPSPGRPGRPGSRGVRDRDDGPDALGPCRADDVRAQARRLGVRGRARPTAARHRRR